LLLSTRENRENPFQLQFRDLNSLRLSPFNPIKPLRVLIHGWWEGEEDDLNVGTSRELLNLYDFNVLFVDWTGSRTISYVETRNRVPTVANFVASYLDFLNENFFLDFNRLTIIGFSIGAHISGHVGKFVRRGRVNTIIGLDPNSLLFSVNNPSERLASGDADYVEAVHSNGGFGNFGIGAPIADADFFPNGGSSQPGCFTNTCSHLRAVHYYSKKISFSFNYRNFILKFTVESLKNNAFFSFRCANANDAGRGRCTLIPNAWMGGEPSNFNKTLRGIYHFDTNRREPFALGPPKP
jgi:pancreatic triacylglycerol lipase